MHEVLHVYVAHEQQRVRCFIAVLLIWNASQALNTRIAAHIRLAFVVSDSLQTQQTPDAQQEEPESPLVELAAGKTNARTTTYSPCGLP